MSFWGRIKCRFGYHARYTRVNDRGVVHYCWRCQKTWGSGA